jgi:hemerythrin-like metal-binding protein
MTGEITPKKPLRWQADYAVGVQEIDSEHQVLFSLVGACHSAMLERKGRDALDSLLNELVDYTCTHFAHEELLMQRIGYPHYQDHLRQHTDLRHSVEAMRQRTDLSDSSMKIELMEFLMDWLKCHTTTSDRRIGTYMRKRGLVP